MKNLENVSFEIISNIGEATACFFEAIELSKNDEFDDAEKAITTGSEYSLIAHRIHADLIKKMANGEFIELNLLLIHAEDQLMNAEVIKMLAEQTMNLYKEINNLKTK